MWSDGTKQQSDESKIDWMADERHTVEVVQHSVDYRDYELNHL